MGVNKPVTEKDMEVATSSTPSLDAEIHGNGAKPVSLRDLDVAAVYADEARERPPTREEEIAVRWRLDRRVMPILFFNVILASVDKTSTSTGAL